MADEALIRTYAYQLWEKAGRPQGRDQEFWDAAKAEVDAESEIPDPSAEQQPNKDTLPG
ncbi:DUF2934 domain-containing protein [Bradyrhizobium sp. BR 10289]|uniref:DUF2934 domain-containing protein n=1 Tax=Bradyrhizobium sp. BR 10289 TaxID=2749993 RepID=UPI001C646223|nr:DUF2934 domain-containing protein [Bradyrhizobium sp. BR 10289]MBW7970029.1 DUF2934 domain-containing protein [Bradyrhizobium sp. BR 10289]